MNNENYQLSQNLESINLIVFNPYNEYYYSYSINGIENKHLIKRLDIIKFLQDLNIPYKDRFQYLIQHFFSFIYIKESDELIELEQQSISNDDYKFYIKDLLKLDTNNNNSSSLKDNHKNKFLDLFKFN